MTIVSLSRTLGSAFLTRLSSLTNPKRNSSNPLVDGDSGDATVSSLNLRAGAELMVGTINVIASGYKAVEASQNFLTSIGKSLDELINLATTASDSRTGKEDRERIAISFRQIANQIQQAVQTARDSKQNIVTKSGLTELLAEINLKPEDLDGLAELFTTMESSTVEGDLFNPDTKAPRPLEIPPNLPGSTSVPEYTSVLDGGQALNTRYGAYTVLADLKAVKENLTKNQEAVTNLADYLSNARRLVRTIGLSLLDISELADGGTSAEQLAFSLQSQVRTNARGALDQLESLDPLLEKASALLRGDDVG